MILRVFGELTAKLTELKNCKRGSDLVTWVGLIALVIAVLIMLFPTARQTIGNFFSGVMSKLQSWIQ